ncbi:hypothetical protein Patl1_13808 [Pistacia atlantica]|uniref:Uncharacterized protein n=1 Tax=Pistacia atlantica TaxID=434234 RepID=A0ACC1AV41_9ROSI|nr:hypothetical protein Patl1_13808 [Pistacia atlantica]
MKLLLGNVPTSPRSCFNVTSPEHWPRTCFSSIHHSDMVLVSSHRNLRCSLAMLSWGIQHDNWTTALGVITEGKRYGTSKCKGSICTMHNGASHLFAYGGLQIISLFQWQLYVATCSPAQDDKGSYVGLGPLHSHRTSEFSFLINSLLKFGEVLATTEHSEDIIVAEIDYSLMDLRRENLPLSKQRRGDLYQLVDIQRLNSQ